MAEPFYDVRMPDFDNERRALKVLALIVVEFETDPMSVQCFDLRTVQEAKETVAERKRLELRGDAPPLLTEGNPNPQRRRW